ncbi:hypothetical protein T484DRAFT_1754628 [Baffinella frigidus]|nr:hypothetical protein T484DRAFT_1754628 [Cryptophyta sp. CCMP2293]
MVVDTQTRSTPMRDWLDSVGTKVVNAFDSFVVRAPKITLLSRAWHPQSPMRASSLPISFEPSSPPSSATARDQLINGSTRRLLPPLPPPITRIGSLAGGKDSGKIPVRAAILALRRAVAHADQLQSERKVLETEKREEEKGQGTSWRRSFGRDATSTATPTSDAAVTNGWG